MMGSRPFRFGISFGGTPSRTELAESVKRAEDAGFSVVSSADHLADRLAVLPLLTVVTQISSMRVSLMVIANDYKHPAVLAREAATIDVLSEGRFELGIGTGWIKDQYDAAGIRYDDARTRVDRFEEAIQVIQGCWSGGQVRGDLLSNTWAGVPKAGPEARPTPADRRLRASHALDSG